MMINFKHYSNDRLLLTRQPSTIKEKSWLATLVKIKLWSLRKLARCSVPPTKHITRQEWLLPPITSLWHWFAVLWWTTVVGIGDTCSLYRPCRKLWTNRARVARTLCLKCLKRRHSAFFLLFSKLIVIVAVTAFEFVKNMIQINDSSCKCYISCKNKILHLQNNLLCASITQSYFAINAFFQTKAQASLCGLSS